MGRTKDQIGAITGLRGIAVLYVVGFHYFYYNPAPNRDAWLYPFGDAMLSFPIFKYGYFGVYLFFVISGFVISLTLENSSSPFDFFIKRVARIWPALLVGSIATYLAIAVLGSPYGQTRHQTLMNFLPSLTLTPPYFWRWTGAETVDLVDGVYWTLLVEARFYMIAGVAFFCFSRGALSRRLVIFTIANLILRAALQRMIPGSNIVYGELLIPDFMPWFVAGAIYFDLYKRRISDLTAIVSLAMMMAIILRTQTFEVPERSTLLTGVISIAIFAIFWPVAKRVTMPALEMVWLRRIGDWSYSIYLLHCGIGMCVISLLPKDMGNFLAILSVACVATLSILAGGISFRFVETPGRRMLQNMSLAKPSVSSLGST